MPIDMLCFAALGYGFWQGFNRGIISTFFNVVAYVFGAVLAFKMMPTTINILERLFNSDNPGLALGAFIANLVIIMIIMRMLAKTLETTFRAFYLGFLNRVAGGLLLGAIAILLYSVLLWFFVKAALVNQSTIAESKLYEPYLKDLPGRAYNVVKRFQPMALDAWDTSVGWMDRLDKYGTQKTEAKQDIYKIPDKDGGIEREPRPGVEDDNSTGIEE